MPPVQENNGGNSPVSRIQKEIQSSLSPKYTEMKTGSRTSRFGRPQKQTEHDANSVPTDLARYVSKSSPKRIKPKEAIKEVELREDETVKMEDLPSNEDKENSSHLQEQQNQQQKPETPVMITKEEDSPMEVEISPIAVNDDDLNASTVNQESPMNISIDPFVAMSESLSEMTPDQVSDEDNNEGDKDKQDMSDTDSALGSATSCSDEFVAGQILWGSFSRNSSWYPCMVYPDSEGNVTGTNSKKARVVHVKYFSFESASLNVNNVFDFKTLPDFWNQITNVFKLNKSRIKPFSLNCFKNIEDACKLLKTPIDERLAIFNNDMLNNTKQKDAEKLAQRLGESSRSVERKSVDSALESTATPFESPSSSSSTHEPARDPFESYLDIISSLSQQKKPVARKSEAKVEVKEEDLGERRRSGRAIKKRKYEDFEEDVKKETKVNESEVGESSKPKAKRQKLQKEETLEERFIIDSKHLRNIFYAVNKKKVCYACHEANSEPTFKCIGRGSIKCAGWFHKDCSGHSETKREEIRHLTGDSDEIIQTTAIKTFVTCKSCFEEVKNCFVCGEQVDFPSEESQQCQIMECRLAYHNKCLVNFPQSKQGNKRNPCPQHTCHTCFSKDIHSSGALVKCVKCPSAFHIQLGCVPAGSVMLSQTQIICPRHPSEKEITRNAKDKNSKPLNIDWCAVCNDSGNLVCCDSCPSSFHYQCIDYEESDDNFICQECQDGRMPVYNSIVWARVGSYRWWPGLIMPNTVLPETVLKTQRYDREFCVRFFGSYDYFWFTCERVFSYDGTNLSVKGGNSRLDSAFNIALEEAHQLFELLNNETSLTVQAKPKPYTKLLSNRAIAPVKLNKNDNCSLDQCTCSKNDPNPCGRNSSCLNMCLNIECNKITCPAEEKCQNQKFSRREYVDLKIVPTGSRGFGAVCQKDVPEDTFIIEYVGDLINSAEFNRRIKAKIVNKEKDFYFLTVSSDLYVDAEPAGNLARFINHSCEPNCITRKVTVDGNTRIGIFSNEFIKAGTELTFDYQMEFIDNKKTACFCGSTKCSGLIGEKPKEPVKRPAAAPAKKKPKRKAAVAKVEAPKPKVEEKEDEVTQEKDDKVAEEKDVEETIDPFESMLKKMPYTHKKLRHAIVSSPDEKENSQAAEDVETEQIVPTADADEKQQTTKFEETNNNHTIEQDRS